MTDIQTRPNGRRVARLKHDSGAAAAVLVDFGCNAFSWQAGGRELLHAPEDVADQERPSPGGFGVPILAPFPNRIAGGRFEYGGKEYRLPQNNGPNAIHGFAYDHPWRLVEDQCGPARLVAEFVLSRDAADRAALWPSDFRLRCTIELTAAELKYDLKVTNVGDGFLPFGLGLHPYFRMPLAAGSLDRCLLDVPARKRLVLQDFLPTGATEPYADAGEPVAIGDRSFDDVYVDLLGETSTLTDPDAGLAVDVVCDDRTKALVVYTPGHRQAACIEPYTCVTDAVNRPDTELGHDLWHVAAGESRSWPVTFRVRTT